MIHTASLVHDDVLDNCSVRRGKDTVNSLYGTRVAVLVGDFLFAQSSWYLANLDNLEVIKLISQVIADFADGEISQAASLFDTEITLDQYLDKSFYKVWAQHMCTRTHTDAHTHTRYALRSRADARAHVDGSFLAGMGWDGWRENWRPFACVCWLCHSNHHQTRHTHAHNSTQSSPHLLSLLFLPCRPPRSSPPAAAAARCSAA